MKILPSFSTMLLTVALGAAQGAVQSLEAQAPSDHLTDLSSPSVVGPLQPRQDAVAARRAAMAGATNPEPSGTGRLLGTTLAASLGSVAGGLGGTMLGLAADPGVRGASVMVGAVAGSLLGATVGSTLVNKNAGRSIVGASAGLLAGGLLVHALGSEIGNRGTVISFALVHGLVTAVIATR